MSRASASALAASVGATLVALALASGRWVVPLATPHDAHGPLVVTRDTVVTWSGRGAFCAGVVGALLAIPMLVLASRRLARVVLVSAVAMILGDAGFVLGHAGAIAVGPGAQVFSLGSLLLAVAALASMPPASAADDIVGAFVDGKRHGRQLVYDRRGALRRIEHWEHGGCVRTEAVGRDGLVVRPTRDA